jgi:hypothetical protein
MRRLMGLTWLGLLFLLAAGAPPLSASWIQDGIGICTATGYQAAPHMIPDGEGGAIMVWEDGRGAYYNIYAQHVDAHGNVQWETDGRFICTASGNQRFPKLASDGAGGAIITWYDYRGGGADIYAQRIDANGVAQWATNGVVVSNATGDQLEPVVVSDDAGGAVICWRTGGYSSSAAYAQRLDASGNALWTANGVRVCTGSTTQYEIRLVSDGAHGAIAAWRDHRTSYYNTYAQRIDSTGALPWGSIGVGMSPGSFNQYYQQMASDGAGGAIATWLDYRGPTYVTVLAQRVDALGVLLWGGGAMAVITPWSTQYIPMIASDGAGGAIIAVPISNGSDTDIYAQRCSPAGPGLWGDGVLVCGAAANQEEVALYPDGTGGAVFAWLDHRNDAVSSYDLYAQRVDGSGAVRWQSGGVPLVTRAGYQDEAQVACDVSGGAIFVWRDYRGGTSYDIYATARTEYGTGIESQTPPATCFLAQNVPNPFNPRTTIRFDLPAAGPVRLAVYDVAGRLVRVLVEGERAAGSYEAVWDGRDASGRSAPSGSYLARLVAGGEVEGVRLSLVR